MLLFFLFYASMLQPMHLHRAFLLILHPDFFLNITKLERLHRAASRAIIGFPLFSPISLLLFEVPLPPYESPSPWHISLSILVSQLFVFQPHLLFQVWRDLEWNLESSVPLGGSLHPLTCLYFLLHGGSRCPPFFSPWNFPSFCV